MSYGVGKEFKEYQLLREDREGVVFLTCALIPDLLIAAEGTDTDIRNYIAAGMKNAFSSDSRTSDVFTNGSIKGPTIDVVVKLTAT